MKGFKDKTSGLINFSDLKHLRFKMLYWLIFAILVIIIAVEVIPIIWVALSGFKTTAEMYSTPPTLLPKSIDLSVIPKVCSKVNFVNAFVNSGIIIIGCWAFDIFMNGILGYVLSRIKPYGSKLVSTLIFWSMLLPGVSMVPLFITFVDVPILHINMTGSFLPIWMMAGCNAFNVLLFRNFFNGIPMSYLEAARIDGCSEIIIFLRIIIPLSKPIIAVVSIFSVIGSWANFLWPYLLLGSTNFEPVAVKLYQLSIDGNIQENEFMLLTMLSIIPPGIMYCIFSKNIMGGLNMSGLKG